MDDFYFEGYESIQDDFLQESEESIDCIFGERISEEQKQELLNSLSIILEKRAKKFLDDARVRNNSNNFISFQNNFANTNNSNPKVNLFLLVPSTNYPAYIPYQPQYACTTTTSPYPINTAPNQPLMPNPLQPYQQPNFQFFGQPQMLNPIQPYSKNKNHKNKNKKKHEHKKSSKSETLKSKSSKSKKKEKEIEAKEVKEEKKYDTVVSSFIFSNSHNFSGVINYLKRQGDIEKMISITSSSTDSSSSLQPKEVITHDNGNTYFKSKNLPNQWVCLDFKEFRVSPTKYTIGTTNDPSKLKSWVIEGSNDQNNWTTINQQLNCSFPKGANNCVFVFTTSSNSMDKFRYLRLRSIGKSWSNNNYVCINSFEIYGTLFK